jgi:hypothetical protein
MKRFFVIVIVFLVSACNSVYMKPGTMEPKTTVHVDPAGIGVERSIKEVLEKRNYDVRIGKQRSTGNGQLTSSDVVELPANTKYIVRTGYSKESFMPMWCMFNGFWWWRFSLSITDQKDGKEILSWRGRGCQNSTMRKLDEILDKLEIKQEKQKNE